MSDDVILTNVIAEQFLEDEDSVDLEEFTAMEDGAAERLSKHEGELKLNGLTSLSDAAAESLGKHEDGYLSLDGLTSLSDAAAESLGKHKGGDLCLNGLTSLSDAAAASLRKCKGGLYLNGLTSLSDAAAESLSKHKSELYLFGLTSLSRSAAKSLARHRKISLDLRNWPEEVVNAFVKIDEFWTALNMGELGTFVCDFCGGDHGATECEEMLCLACFKPDCNHAEEEKCTSGEAIERIEERIWDHVPEEEAGSLREQFGFDLPIELFAHIVATYSIPAYDEYLKELFPVSPPDDGRIWNRSRKFGDCYKFAFQAQEYEADKMRELVGSDEEVLLVHGYGRVIGDYIGHAWVEVGDYVIDCGSLRNLFTVFDRDEYYSSCSVKYPKRYTAEEALKKFSETVTHGPWSDPPDDIPLKDEYRALLERKPTDRLE